MFLQNILIIVLLIHFKCFRARPMKNLKYDKRRRLSNSPVRHLGPTGPRRPVSPHAVRDLSPYLSEQYQSSTIPHPQQYSPPIRKKTRRFVLAVLHYSIPFQNFFQLFMLSLIY